MEKLGFDLEIEKAPQLVSLIVNLFPEVKRTMIDEFEKAPLIQVAGFEDTELPVYAHDIRLTSFFLSFRDIERHYNSLVDRVVINRDTTIRSEDSKIFVELIVNKLQKFEEKDIATAVYNFLADEYKDKNGTGLKNAVKRIPIFRWKQRDRINKLYSGAYNEFAVIFALMLAGAGKAAQKIETQFTAKEYALAYIFDLYSKGKQVPTNRTDDAGLDAKYLKSIGSEKTKNNHKGDTFYRAVKDVITYDLNNEKSLKQISTGWLSAILNISDNNTEIIEYLDKQHLM